MIISAFPGTGKSYYSLNNPDCLDLDSSSYSWETSTDGYKYRSSKFPMNYVNDIDLMRHNYRHVFVSSHKEVRYRLVDSFIPFALVYPDKSLKDQFIDIYTKRGNTKSFIEQIDKSWESWIEEIESFIKSNNGVFGYKLFEGETMTDLLDVRGVVQ